MRGFLLVLGSSGLRSNIHSTRSQISSNVFGFTGNGRYQG
jgi:hypothetical protein